MNIILNNNNESFEADKLSITELLALKKFTFKMLIIKINGKLIKQENYSTSFIKDGDDVMVLHLISGG
ncbi:MAG: sulfur carrier protein ThiS [Bacteroidota bacterium]